MKGDFMTFADCLRLIRLSVYMSQATLAEMSGIALGTIKGWETSRQFPTPEHFGTLVEFFEENDASPQKIDALKEIYLQCKKK